MLITALHATGLATLTHTPSPMGFLNEILGRPPDAERPYLLLVAGRSRRPGADREGVPPVTKSVGYSIACDARARLLPAR